MGLLKEQYAEWKKVRLQYCCHRVWTKNGGQIQWNVTAICETFKISCLMGRHPMRGVLENLLKDQWFRLVHWLSITLFLRKTSQESTNLDRERVLPGLFLGYALYAGGIWKGGCRHWGVGNDGRIGNLFKKTQCKGSNISHTKWKIHFPVADGRIKLPGDQELRTSTLVRDHPIRGEGQRDFLGESEGSPPSPPQDSYPDGGEAINEFWSMSGNLIYRHHVEPRVKLYSPREESFPVPLKYIDVSRTTHTNLDVMQESRIDDYWNIDGSRDLSHSWTGFTQFTLLNEKPPDGFLWSGWRLTTRKAQSRPDHLWPELRTKLARNVKLREKHMQEDMRNLFHWPWGQGVQRNH